jgi:hypothetical protein
MQMHEDALFFQRDDLTKDRTSIFTTVAFTKKETTLVIAGPSIEQLEWQDFRLLWKNKVDPTFNFTPLHHPWALKPLAGLDSVGYRFAEVVPWWFNSKTKYSPPPLTAGMV